MNTQQWLIGGVATAILAIVVASGFAGSYFYARQQNAALEHAQLELAAKVAEADQKREALFAPQISTASISCDLRPGDETLSAKNVSFTIQASDPSGLVQKILTFSKKYPNASLSLTSYTTDSFNALDTYKSQYVVGFVPVANTDEFYTYVKNLEDKKNIFIPNVYNSTRPAHDIYLTCISERDRIQTLALKEAVYIDELKKSTSLDEKTLNIVTQDLTNARSDYSYIIHNGNVPNPLRIQEQLEGTVFSISISDLKG